MKLGRLSLALLASATCALSVPAAAAPVGFSVSPNAFTPEGGYGTGLGDLDVAFSIASGLNTFSLAAGESTTFQFGTVTLNESLSIGPLEVNDLGVTATFQFFDPLAGLRDVVAVGTATQGLLIDGAVDLVIEWAPVLVSFADGGSFQLSMNTLEFSRSGQSATQKATITLISEPLQVPEPTSLSLVGLAFAGLGAARRRRHRG